MKYIIDDKNKTIIFTQSDKKDWVLFKNTNLTGWDIRFEGVSLTVDDRNQILTQRFNSNGMTGCLNIYNSTFDDTKIHVKGGQCEDSLNIISSIGKIDQIIVSESYSDAIDFDFSNIFIRDTLVNDAGNDCLDLSGGRYTLIQATLRSCNDKGISVGEKSILNVENVDLVKSNIGISVKDLSSLDANKVIIIESPICIEAIQKKQEFGGGYAKVVNINCSNLDNKDKVSTIFRGE